MSQTDQECVLQCLNGHPDDYVWLVRRYQAPLVSYLNGRLGSTERAEEAAQETFVRGYFALNRLDQAGSFFSWLTGIANRVVLEKHRSRKRAREIQYSGIPEPAPADGPDAGDLKQVVAALPRPYADVIWLRYYGGLSCAEVGERLRVPLGTVTKRLSRAYVMLRESMGERKARHKGNEVQP